ncbi:cadmium transporter [Rhodococcus spelaei]|uniref:Cadmium transporter n=1 Tax=Rhodococcus spelaei TaxID=2546320 RepID=A0A541BPR7_9NOCA|nr:cadmium resistance transporter [Rhodococcus spelaei]TQF74337.1 cadmium transporter [Rhodococcus spelaei]
MDLAFIGRAVGLFAVTNIDDLVVLTLFFGRVVGQRRAESRVVAGQYLGFVGIVCVSVAGGLGVGLLPDTVIPYLGILPLALGIRYAMQAWRGRVSSTGGADAPAISHPTVGAVAAVTISNGGDNIGVYVPVFAAADLGEVFAYAAVFLLLVAVWCAAGRYFANRPMIAAALARWDHIVLPVVLVAIGADILVRGGAFGL